MKLNGEEHESTLIAANNYAATLKKLQHFKDVKALLREIISVAQRVLGESDQLTIRLRWNYAESLYKADGAALGDFREASAMFEDMASTAQRIFGGAHPLVVDIGNELRNARAALAAREGDLCEALEAI